MEEQSELHVVKDTSKLIKKKSHFFCCITREHPSDFGPSPLIGLCPGTAGGHQWYVDPSSKELVPILRPCLEYSSHYGCSLLLLELLDITVTTFF